MTGAVTVRLIRHGQTRGYQEDLGLSELGRDQVLDKAAALAAELDGDSVVRLPHAPTNRAAETAQVLADGLHKAGVPEERLGAPQVDPWFDNFRLWCDGRALDPTQAMATYQGMRDGTPAADRPGWFAEMHRFVEVMAGGDPIAYWLTQPLQHFEPAATAVRRFWTGIRRAVAEPPPGLCVLVSTHSGCIRAVATAALGYDPGEPENTEDVTIRIAPGQPRAKLTYRGQAVEVVMPVTTRPPWCPEWTETGT
jgi:broad specificity phosphatase PhoE